MGMGMGMGKRADLRRWYGFGEAMVERKGIVAVVIVCTLDEVGC